MVTVGGHVVCVGVSSVAQTTVGSVQLILGIGQVGFLGLGPCRHTRTWELIGFC